MAVVMNKEQIMEVIPHRDPFLLIDEVNEIYFENFLGTGQYLFAAVLNGKLTGKYSMGSDLLAAYLILKGYNGTVNSLYPEGTDAHLVTLDSLGGGTYQFQAGSDLHDYVFEIDLGAESESSKPYMYINENDEHNGYLMHYSSRTLTVWSYTPSYTYFQASRGIPVDLDVGQNVSENANAAASDGYSVGLRTHEDSSGSSTINFNFSGGKEEKHGRL